MLIFGMVLVVYGLCHPGLSPLVESGAASIAAGALVFTMSLSNSSAEMASRALSIGLETAGNLATLASANAKMSETQRLSLAALETAALAELRNRHIARVANLRERTSTMKIILARSGATAVGKQAIEYLLARHKVEEMGPAFSDFTAFLPGALRGRVAALFRDWIEPSRRRLGTGSIVRAAAKAPSWVPVHLKEMMNGLPEKIEECDRIANACREEIERNEHALHLSGMSFIDPHHVAMRSDFLRHQSDEVEKLETELALIGLSLDPSASVEFDYRLLLEKEIPPQKLL
jgi:hypothetical protein